MQVGQGVASESIFTHADIIAKVKRQKLSPQNTHLKGIGFHYTILDQCKDMLDHRRLIVLCQVQINLKQKNVTYRCTERERERERDRDRQLLAYVYLP